MADICIQGLGYLGLLAFLISYQTKSNHKLYLWQFLGSGLFSLQMFLLGAVSGCFTLIVNSLRNGAMAKRLTFPWLQNRLWAWIFAVAYFLVLLLTWKNFMSLLPFVASAACTFCYWTNNASMIRKVDIFCSVPCWAVYDIYVHSWGGLLSELLTLASVLFSIYRFGWKALSDPNSDFQKE